MNPKLAIRIGTDFAMFAVLFMLMGYSITGNAIHEWMGIALAVLFGIHISFNFAWVKSIAKGRYTAKRTAGTVINVLMFVATTVTIVSAIPISGTVFRFIPAFADGMTMYRLHVLGANWMYVLIAIHLGMQWSRFLNTLLNRQATDRPPTIVWKILCISVIIFAAYGVFALINRGILPKLIMYYSFDMWRGDTAFLMFFVDYISIFILFVTFTHYILILSSKKGTTISDI